VTKRALKNFSQKAELSYTFRREFNEKNFPHELAEQAKHEASVAQARSQMLMV
jgi:hypothetical protein